MQLKKFYKGFSTRAYEKHGGNFETYNVKCVEEDILNEIFTIRGERVYMPSYGTRIPLLVFEPNDAATMDVIREDLNVVVSHEPRVILENLDVIQMPDKNTIMAVMKLTYIEFAVTSDLYIEVKSN